MIILNFELKKAHAVKPQPTYKMGNVQQFCNKQYQQHRNFILYGVIGCVTTAIDVGIFTLLAHWNMHELLANTISYQVAMVASFFLNREFNFKIKDKVWQRFLSFFIVNLIGYAFSQLLVFLFITKFGMPDIIGKLLATILAAVCQFLFIKHLTFKVKKTKNSEA
jgi:putative flippase GtrA